MKHAGYDRLDQEAPSPRSCYNPFVLVLVFLTFVVTAAIAVMTVLIYMRINQVYTDLPINQPDVVQLPQNLAFEKDALDSYYATRYASDVNNLAAQWIAYFNSYFVEHPSGSSSTVVIFDIDETVLNNYPYYNSTDYGFEPLSWNSWVQSASAPNIPGTLSLFNALLKLGTNVIFITGRQDTVHNATLANLQTAGFSGYLQLIDRNSTEYYLSADVYKSNRRQQVAQKYTIIGCIGDQVSDCSLGYTGNYIMKMINYIYFIP